jgi:hypothetical protein
LKPVTFDMTVFMGSQGEEKADWTTEWFYITDNVLACLCRECVCFEGRSSTFATNWN